MKTVDFSETIAASDLKVGRCRQLIEFMKLCEHRRSRSFLYHIFSRFCMSCALLAKISGERLQDHWSSGSPCNAQEYTKRHAMRKPIYKHRSTGRVKEI